MTRTWTTILFLWFSGQLMATHIIGGDIRYRYLGNHQYEVTLTVYRDCYNGVPWFDNPAHIGIFGSQGNLIRSVAVSNPIVTLLPANASNPCLVLPVNVCVQRGIYTTIEYLPPRPGGYTLTYQRCCRNNTILNLTNPGSQGATYTTRIPDVNQYGYNTSPQFVNYPPIGICVNEPLSFDHSATDADGDSLAYELVAPLAGSFPGSPMPVPPAPPPYQPVQYRPGYSATYPMAASPPLYINPITGLLTGTPTLQGQFVVGIQVKEYRNGRLLATYMRDFQFNVVACPPIARIRPVIDSFYCQPYRVQFNSIGSSGATLWWDFGDTTNPNSVSSHQHPWYVYPDTGVYTVRLIAQRNAGCRDTAYTKVTIRKGLRAGFTATTACLNDPVHFADQSLALRGNLDSWTWYFGDGAMSTDTNPTHTYALPGVYPVMLITTTSAGCADTAYGQAIVLNLPVISTSPDTTVCPGKPLSLTATGGVHYLWRPTATGVAYNGAVFNISPQAPGVYYVTVTDFYGCSATDSVAVALWPPGAVTAPPDAAVCPGETVTLSASGALVYAWYANGVLVDTGPTITFVPTQSGPLVVEGTNVHGCTTTDTVRVDINPFPLVVAPADTAVCLGAQAALAASGGVDYLWMPGGSISPTLQVAPLSATTYTVSATDANGCSGSATVHVDVLPLPQVVSGPDRDVCPGTMVQLMASGALHYVWQPSLGLSSSHTANPIALAQLPVTYTVTGTDAAGCRNTATVSLNLLPTPPLQVTPDDTTLCAGTSLRLRATGGLSYTWYPTTGLSCSSCPDPQAAPMQNTVYTVIATNALGCVSSDTALVKVHPHTSLSIGGSVTLCQGDTATISLQGAASYAWQPAAYIDCDTCATVRASPPYTTAFTVEYTDSLGCSFDTLFAVTVLPLPVVQHYPNPAAMCPGDSVEINLLGAQSYRWISHPSLSCDTCATVTAKPPQSIHYEVEGTNIFGCSSTHKIPVTVYPLPLPALQGDTTVCRGDSVTLSSLTGINWTWSTSNAFLLCTNCQETAVILNAPTTVHLTVIDQNGCRGADSMYIDLHPAMRIRAEPDTTVCAGDLVWLRANSNLHYQWLGQFPGGLSPQGPLHFAPQSPGWVRCIATDSYGCKGRDSVYLDIIPLPQADAGPDQSTLRNLPVMLHGSGTGSYHWEPAALASPANSANPMVTPPESQWFTLWVSDAAGCTNFDTVWVEVIDPGEVRIPNAFSPNGDGMNDLFFPVVPIYYDIEFFQIFSRWGQLIYEGKGHMAMWDGTFNGQPQPLGTYVYQVHIQTPYGYPIHLKGNVTLVR